MTRAECLKQIADWEQRGELLRAVDCAAQGLALHPEEKAIAYRLVLCLARAGATESARRRYQALGLDRDSDEDSAALGARLLKDRALGAGGPERNRLLVEAAERYEAVHLQTGGYFPAINSATLFRLADDARASSIATRALQAIANHADGAETYYEAVTRAEASLVLGDADAAHDALKRASTLDVHARAARASTRRQLRMLCRHLGLDDKFLDAIANPPVVHFCGHRVSGTTDDERLPKDSLDAVADDVRRHLTEAQPCAGYGSLAAGADILFAETLLEMGAELHVVLPFDEDDFVTESVTPAGDGWGARFHRCLEGATSVRRITTGPFLGDGTLFRHANSVAMGLTCLRASMLDSRPLQMSVWDGKTTGSVVGTEAGIEGWAALGHSQIIIDSRSPRLEAPTLPLSSVSNRSRQFRAIVFGDFDGFSSLPEALVPEFVDRALGAAAETLRDFERHVRLRNTWGDGLYIVFDDLVAAGQWALRLQTRLSQSDWRGELLPTSLTLRVSCHFGPVFECLDPVVQRPGFFGTEVSKTARIEPVTPEGSVYVTEQFAALLALQPRTGLACDYVGTVPTAKGYGDIPLYLLRREGE